MNLVSFKEYEDAKREIISGFNYKEVSELTGNGRISKRYATYKNGTFYECTDPNTGITEFWSDKHSESRYYKDYTEKERFVIENDRIKSIMDKYYSGEFNLLWALTCIGEPRGIFVRTIN